MTAILISWIGATDLRARNGTQPALGLGPIAQAVIARNYDQIALISDFNQNDSTEFANWLQTHTETPISIEFVTLTSPTNFGEIYQAAVAVLSSLAQRFGKQARFTFHLSPGTPAMAAVWIIIAKTRFPAELIESSREHGVRTVSVPFEISADFIPDLLHKPDKTLAHLAAGLTDEAPEFADIIHRSEVMKKAILRARRIAPRSIPVLIEGESGTGKELFARALHASSPRREKPFITINCGAIPSELVETEFFGHEKGAFTGADTTRVGHFEAAHQGTIFLDEIGELPKTMQVKLLRTVQESEIKRIGSNKTCRIDVRIIAATNRDLISEVAVGNFREDLFYRLAVAVIKLPPLRDRASDINLLADHFLSRINRESCREPGYEQKKLSPSARNLIKQYPWPGNIRELQNTLTRAAVWTVGDRLEAEDIREALLPINEAPQGDNILNRPLDPDGIDLPKIIHKVAVHYLERGLTETRGNKTKAAQLLGLPSYQTLSNWLKKYGLE